jgi:hypothetical protein
MAQTGYTPISIYYSSTSTNVPTAGNLVAGELAINTADGKLFYKDSAGVVQTIASKATGTVPGSTTQVIYNNAGALAGSNNLIFDGSQLGIGVTPASGRILDIVQNSGPGVIQLTSYRAAAGQSTFSTRFARGTVSSPTVVINGDTIGVWDAYPYNGSNFTLQTAQMQYVVNGTVTSSSIPTDITFSTDPAGAAYASERMRITSAGNVGIGTTSPTGKLAVAGIVKSTALSTVGNDGVWMDFSAPNGRIASINSSGGPASNLQLATTTTGGTTTTALTIDYNQNIGIGTASPATKLDVNGSIQIRQGNSLYLENPTGYSPRITNTSTATDMQFYTNNSERMRIDTSGNLLVGTTSTSSPASGSVINLNSGGSFQDIGHANGTGSGTRYEGFIYNTSLIGSITQSGTTAVLYNVTSDRRLKTNIVDAPSGNIDDIKVRSFDWITDNTHQTYGMVAQELLEVAPYAVHQPQEPEEMMAVDYSKLVPMMIKEIQDLKQRIATLEKK